jgi:hypothetical protein
MTACRTTKLSHKDARPNQSKALCFARVSTSVVLLLLLCCVPEHANAQKEARKDAQKGAQKNDQTKDQPQGTVPSETAAEQDKELLVRAYPTFEAFSNPNANQTRFGEICDAWHVLLSDMSPIHRENVYSIQLKIEKSPHYTLLDFQNEDFYRLKVLKGCVLVNELFKKRLTDMNSFEDVLRPWAEWEKEEEILAEQDTDLLLRAYPTFNRFFQANGAKQTEIVFGKIFNAWHKLLSKMSPTDREEVYSIQLNIEKGDAKKYETRTFPKFVQFQRNVLEGCKLVNVLFVKKLVSMTSFEPVSKPWTTWEINNSTKK